jgi:hypothetical protein
LLTALLTASLTASLTATFTIKNIMKVNHTIHKHPNQNDVDNRIQEILTHFDFQKVQTAMKALNWTWYGSNGTPTIDEMRATALNLLRSATKDLSEDYYSSSTGGFHVEYRKFHSKEDGYWYRLDLAFCVDSTLHEDGIGF